MSWIFIVFLLIVVHFALVKWKEAKDKPIEFDTPLLKARREKFKKSAKEKIKDFFDGEGDSYTGDSGD